MFLEFVSNVGTSTISIPLMLLSDSTGNVLTKIGVSVSSSALPNLSRLGLFNYDVAEKISKSILESGGKTLTGHWMDLTGPFETLKETTLDGVSRGLHRGVWGHDIFTDALTVLKDKDLSIINFYKHLGTDIVTKNGLPLLPASTINSIADTLGVSVNKVIPWVSQNILDIGGSILAVWDSFNTVTLLISGGLDWSAETFISTFGTGGIKIAAGFITENPIIIGSGAVDIGCGIYSAVEYYSQPFLCGVPLIDILQGGVFGAGFASLIGLTEIYFKRQSTSTSQKLSIMAERIATGGILSAMSVIALPLSISCGIGLSMVKLSAATSKAMNDQIAAMPIEGRFSREIDEFIIQKNLKMSGSEFANKDFSLLSKEEKKKILIYFNGVTE